MGKLQVSARYGLIVTAEFLEKKLNKGENWSMDRKKLIPN